MRKNLSQQEFLKLNRSMALHHIIETAQDIDRHWPHQDGLNYLLKLLQWCAHHPQQEVQNLGSHSHVWRHEQMSYEHFLGVLVPLERDYAKAVVDHDFIPSFADHQDPTKVRRSPLHAICDNIRSAFNIGAMFRSADCLGLESIHLCGYTATPENSKTKKAAMGSDQWVNWQWHAHSRDAVQHFKQQGIPVIALETLPHSPSIYQYSWPKPCALLLGNERHGLAPDLLQEVDQVCHIPVYGYKNSLNIGTAFALAAGEIIRQWHGG
ncbi:MAG: RNA methyltransferase [Oligoflexus sp.]